MGTFRFMMVSAVSAAFVLSSCSPNSAFQRNASFSQEDHIDGDIPQIPEDPSNPNSPKNPDNPNPGVSPAPSSEPNPVPSVVPSPKASSNPNPSVLPSARPSDCPKKDDKKDDGEYDDDSVVPDYARCGNKGEKVLVCHVPPGNPAAAHSICISVQGAIHGHDVPLDGSVSAVSGDRLGECPAPAPSAAQSHGKGKK